MMKRIFILKLFLTIFFLFSIYILFAIPDEVLLSFDTESYVDDEKAVMQIMDILKEYDANATFFVMGSFAQSNPDILLRMADEGHEIACHTQNHKKLWNINKEEVLEEIRNCKISIESITSTNLSGFRAPWRIITPKTFEVLKSQNFLYDASLFEHTPFYSSEIKEVKTTIKWVLPLDDYIILNGLHIPKIIYFSILKNSFDKQISISFHPHIIMKHDEEFKNLIKYYHQKNITFLTHKESLNN